MTLIFYLQGGDADTNGAVAGALLGCKLGASKIPETWISGLKHKKWLDKKINRSVKIRYFEVPDVRSSIVERIIYIYICLQIRNAWVFIDFYLFSEVYDKPKGILMFTSM